MFVWQRGHVVTYPTVCQQCCFVTGVDVFCSVRERRQSCSSPFFVSEMSPAHTPRQLLVWSLPTVAVLLTFLWYKRRKNIARADLGGIDPSTSTRLSEPLPEVESVVQSAKDSSVTSSPVIYSRSLSGRDSAPIDIKSARSAPLIISDTELDLEIEKIKSMKAGASLKKYPGNMSVSPIKRRSPRASSVTPVSNGSSNDARMDLDESMHHRGHSVDRDSANHSPADAMLPASPSLSSISDNQSDSDSGKGGSDVATPPPAQQQPQENIDDGAAASADVDVTVYEFIIAQQLVGRLIGRYGTFVHHIRDKTNARILIKRHPDNNSKLKVCAIEGTMAEIEAALAMIRDKFPAKRYPDLNLDRVSFVPIVPDCMHLRLIEGVNNDTIVSSVVTPKHLFLQQPTHPTFPNLNTLAEYMNACYADSTCQTLPPPPLPQPVLVGTICAAQSCDGWFRASVISVDDDSATACVQFLDYGGYTSIPYTSLRQIRGDFLLLPFQAAECLLANVEPLNGDSEDDWSQEAYEAIVELTHGAVAFTQVIDYDADGVTPLVYIYVRAGPGQRGVILLNRELADRGHARWVDSTYSTR